MHNKSLIKVVISPSYVGLCQRKNEYSPTSYAEKKEE